MPQASARVLLVPFIGMFIAFGLMTLTSPSALNVSITILSGVCILILARQARHDARAKAETKNEADSESLDLEPETKRGAVAR